MKLIEENTVCKEIIENLLTQLKIQNQKLQQEANTIEDIQELDH